MGRFSQLLRVGLLGACLFAWSAPAMAGDEAARAEALFHEGRAAMTAGDYVKACSKFEASQKLLRGPGTLLNLGDCYEKSGWPAKAYRAYREAVRLAVEMKKPDRERAAQARMRAVSSKIHLVQFTGAQERLAATIDGAATDLREVAPLEEGRHVLKVTAGGVVVWQKELDAPKGKTSTIDVPPIGESPPVVVNTPPPTEPKKAEPAKPTPAPTQAQPAASEPASAPPASMDVDPVGEPPPPVISRKTLGLIVGGVGIVGLGVGTVLGAQAKSTYDDTKDHCSDRVCDPTGHDLTESAKTSAMWSTISFIAGGALLAGGVVLFLTAPSDTARAARMQVTPLPGGGAGASLRGTF